MKYEVLQSHKTLYGTLSVGDHVKKVVGKTKLRGRLCAIYRVPHEDSVWCVVLIDQSEASDHLQHLYPIAMFAPIIDKNI